MTIAILGAGNMGKGLAKRLAAAGEEVLLAARDQKKTAEAAKAIGGKVKAATPSAAASAGIIILAVPYAQAGAALNELGDLAGKVIVDITNAVGPNMSMAVTGNSSAAEEIQKKAGKAKVVKAFNTLFANFFDKTYAKNPPQVFYAGDDAAAKERVAALIRQIGFEPVDAGPLENARQLEAMGNLAIRVAYSLGRGTTFTPAFLSH
jgi:8-hydroxy-5-deazaflavin:NADPH oxidoreductase